MKAHGAVFLFFLLTGLVKLSAQGAERVSPGEDFARIAQQEDALDFKWDYFLYPVPATEELNVKVTKGQATIRQVNIRDEFGNDVLVIRDISSDKIKVDIASLPEGNYYILIIPGDQLSPKMKRFYVTN